MSTHDCGGTILTAASPDKHADPRDYFYCDRCGAFRFGSARLPDGTNKGANRVAWDDGEDQSPEAHVYVELESPVGPRAVYDSTVDEAEVLAALPAGWTVHPDDWSNSVLLGRSDGCWYSVPLSSEE